MLPLTGCQRDGNLTLPSARTSQPTPGASEVVATVGGEPVSADEVRRLMARQGGALAERYESIEAKRKLLGEILEAKALAVAGRRAGYDQDPEIREVVDRMVADRYLRALVAANPGDGVISDAEVRTYYDNHRAEFAPVERVRASIIVLRDAPSTAPGEQTAVRALAESLRHQAADPATTQTFANLAKQHSVDPLSRERGGDIGWIPKGAVDYRIDPKVVEAMFGLAAVGEVSPVIETKGTLVIVKLTDRSMPEPRPLAEVAATIKENLRAEREKALKEQRMKQLAGQLDIKVNDEVLARIGPAQRGSDAVPRPPSFPVAVPDAEKAP